jgi:hypothetical protein
MTTRVTPLREKKKEMRDMSQQVERRVGTPSSWKTLR